MTIKYLVTRDGREYVMDAVPDWAQSDEYKIEKLSSVEDGSVLDTTIINTDDTAERLQLMEELFQLQETDIALLKAQLEKFVEVVEDIVELTDVVSHSAIENRSKILLINDSCKKLLAPV